MNDETVRKDLPRICIINIGGRNGNFVLSADIMVQLEKIALATGQVVDMCDIESMYNLEPGRYCAKLFRYQFGFPDVAKHHKRGKGERKRQSAEWRKNMRVK